MNLSRDERNLIFYLRYSLIIGPLSATAFLLISIFGANIHISALSTALLALLSAVPGYLILPGLLYEDFKAGMTFTVDQMVYYIFAMITLGIGPSILFFSKYDPVLKKMTNEK